MSDTEAKTDPASQRKLRKKREEGVVPAAMDIAGLAASAAGLLALLAATPWLIAQLTNAVIAAFETVTMPFDEAMAAGLHRMLAVLGWTVGLVAAAALMASILVTILYNKGLVFAIKPVLPQLTRVSPKAGLARIYGRRGWIETAAGIGRIAVWTGAGGLIAWVFVPDLYRAWGCATICSGGQVIRLGVTLLLAAVVMMMLALSVDMLVQRALFLHEQRMTKTEVKRERKEQGGNPEIRRERRRQQRAMAAGAGAVGLARANMGFVSGTRAVAIQFDPPAAPLPRIAAKARDAAAVRAMRAELARAQHPVLDDQAEIVEAGLRVDVGEVLPQTAFTAFGQAMRRISDG